MRPSWDETSCVGTSQWQQKRHTNLECSPRVKLTEGLGLLVLALPRCLACCSVLPLPSLLRRQLGLQRQNAPWPVATAVSNRN
jgi:hypothetical protein